MMGRKGSGLMALPFLRLQTDGFWKPVANSGYDSNVDYNVTSMVNLNKSMRSVLIRQNLAVPMFDFGYDLEFSGSYG